MLELRTKRLGIDKGIPTLINAAASIDDVYAITWFSLILSSITSGSEDNSSQIWTIIRAPLEVIGGVILGGILGVILWIFPDPKLTSIKLRRISLLLSLSFAALFGTEYLGLETVGPIAVLILGFTAALRWRQLSRLECLKEEKLLKNAWDYIGLPFLFCLIGYQLNLEQLDKGSIAQAVAILACGIFIRCIVAALAVIRTKLNLKEKIFVAVSWLPKATVQAALAPVLLDMTRTNPSKFGIYQSEGIIILTVSIISILMTAPAGAILIRLLGPILLTKSRDPPKDDPIELEEKVLNSI
uniref:Cation/H+ exchanger domain-containing protein n=1 Tax=Panagrolaimus davidi TaxID=227884 RepID=A0A914QKB6_9BILA